jgi:hypothetical protein
MSWHRSLCIALDVAILLVKCPMRCGTETYTQRQKDDSGTIGEMSRLFRFGPHTQPYR